MEGIMRKVIYLALALSLFIYCGPGKGRVERSVEDGLEVVTNHIEPYRIRGESGAIHLEKEFSIDTEKEEILEIGLTSIETFDVDSEGYIYLIQWETGGNYIFKFDSKGNFLTSFCRRGQGPGEIEYGGSLQINPQGELIAKDPSKRKFLVYNLEGGLLREVNLEKNYSLIPLANGNYFLFWGEDTSEFRKQFVGIGNSEFKDVKELDRFQYPNAMNVRSPVNRDRLIYGVSRDRVYIGNSERGYEIRVYDLEGNLVRKIRKEYKPVEVSEEIKEGYFELLPEGDPLRDNSYFTKNWPCFRDLFTDDDGHLFVMTFEEGLNPGEYMYDIFNSEGIFIGRASFRNAGRLLSFPSPLRAKKSRLYCLREKESGYKELEVYKVNWE
jgi:hypothetical protein